MLASTLRPLLLCSLLLAPVALGGPAPRPEGADRIAYWDFGVRPDRDFVRPDDWVRLYSDVRDYPFYVDALLTSEAAAVGSRSLMFRLDRGGNCAYFTPPQPASDDFAYVATVQVKTDDLRFDEARLMLEFLDAQGERLGQPIVSRGVSQTQDWTLLQVGPVTPTDPATAYVRLACVSQHGPLADLAGKAYFDDVWLGRLPRFEVTSSQPYRLFVRDDPAGIRIEVLVTGLRDPDTGRVRPIEARFFLSDEAFRPLDERVATLRELPTRGTWTADWDLPVPDVGYYHLEIRLNEGTRQVLSQDYPVTVVDARSDVVGGGFGLAFPPLSPEDGLEHAEWLLTNSGSRWLKVPIWEDARGSAITTARRGAFSGFLEKLKRQGHQVVGVLQKPPDAIMEQFARLPLGVADVFSLAADKWEGPVADIVARYGLMVTHWQLGGDADPSFAQLPELQRRLPRIEQVMASRGHDLHLGIAWPWLAGPLENPPRPRPGLPAASNVAGGDGVLSFVSLTDAPPYAALGDEGLYEDWSPFSADDLERYLASKRGPPAWVRLVPLSSGRYERVTRVRDLVLRMVAGRVAGADALIADRLFDPERGLVAADGAPTELYTVWRTFAVHLADRLYAGRLILPSAIETRVFVGPSGETVIVAWAAEPTEAEMVLGRAARVTNAWGRDRELPGMGVTKTVTLDRLPVILTNLDGPLIRFQLELGFEAGELAGRRGRQSDTLRVTNTFDPPLQGEVAIEFPGEWSANPTLVPLQLAPGRRFEQPVTFEIPPGAEQGERWVPLDFRFAAEEAYDFRLYRRYRLGGRELLCQSIARLLPDGRLEIEMMLTNRSPEPLRLVAEVRPFQRFAERRVLPVLPPDESTNARIYLADGEELLSRPIRLTLTDQLNRQYVQRVEIAR